MARDKIWKLCVEILLQIADLIWLLFDLLYRGTGWAVSWLCRGGSVVWQRLGRRRRPLWRLCDTTGRLAGAVIFLPLLYLIRKLKASLDSSKRLRLGVIVFLPLLLIAALWPPWYWGRWYPYQHGIASYYGRGFYFKRTASGELFLPGPFFTAAHKNLPLGTEVLVVNRKTGSSVVVRINDRGPFVKGRIIDLSVAAAMRLGIVQQGIAEVTLYVRQGKGKPFWYYPFK